ncbi:MAG: vanadium-dependent haloperoxidase [Ilumatobacteraceae bacterium]
MGRTRTASLAALAIGALVGAVGVVDTSLARPVRADATSVIHWNEVTVNTLAALPGPNGGAPPALQVNMGMVQGAVYDAVNAIGSPEHRPYLLRRRFGSRASIEAAVATAAYEVARDIVANAGAPPSDTERSLSALATEYGASLAAVDAGPSKRRGVDAGHAAAAAMLAAREDDGRFGPSQWEPDPAVGHWQPLINPAGLPILDPTPWVGGVEPFLVQSSSQFRSGPPPALESADYAEQFNEVANLGRAEGSTRTTDETYVARWWQSAPTRSWNEVARQLIARNDLDAADASRLLAMQNLSAADASITCWNDKYHYDFWRPWNAIPRAADDGNPATTADADWTALITAPYPEWPSGHNCQDAAHVAFLRMFFGDAPSGGFQITSVSTLLTTESRVRTFATFSQPLGELIDARIWAGLHFRDSDVAGQQLGFDVAAYAAANFFQPVRNR